MSQMMMRCVMLGATCGMRSTFGPALTARSLSGRGNGDLGRLSFMATPGAARALAWLAVGECLADKVPGIPARTQAGPMVVRLIAGSLSAAAVATAKRRGGERDAAEGFDTKSANSGDAGPSPLSRVATAIGEKSAVVPAGTDPLAPLAAAAGGAAGAMCGTFGFYLARRLLTLGGLLPDWTVAVAEDVLAVTLAQRALSPEPLPDLIK